MSAEGEIISYGFNHGYHQACSCDQAHGHKNPHALHAEVMALSSDDPEIFHGAIMGITHAPCDLGCTDLIVKMGLSAVYYLGTPSSQNGLYKLSQHHIHTQALG